MGTTISASACFIFSVEFAVCCMAYTSVGQLSPDLQKFRVYVMWIADSHADAGMRSCMAYTSVGRHGHGVVDRMAAARLLAGVSVDP